MTARIGSSDRGQLAPTRGDRAASRSRSDATAPRSEYGARSDRSPRGVPAWRGRAARSSTPRRLCPSRGLRPKAIPNQRSPSAGKDHLGYDRYVVDTGRCFPYFAKHQYCSICLPVCVYNHKEWARDFEGTSPKLFPTLVMHEAPPAVALDGPQGARYTSGSIGEVGQLAGAPVATAV
jgi:hypothetical protein